MGLIEVIKSLATVLSSDINKSRQYYEKKWSRMWRIEPQATGFEARMPSILAMLRPIPLLGAWVSASFFLQSPAQTFDDIGLNDFELKEIETKELNALLKKKKIDDNRQKEIKQRRRTLKNRWNSCLLLASTDIWKE